MSRLRRALAAAAAAIPLLAGVVSAPNPASAAAPDATYTISIGSVNPYKYPTDTPAASYVDKDGTFYFQQSAALYGASEPRYWDFYTGTDFDDATRSATISDAVNPANSSDRNNDTTWRCNNSPTGVTATSAGPGSGYSQKNFCDLVGVWADPDTGDWYGLVHNEFTPQPFGDGLHYDAIDYAVSRNQGKVWTILGHAITSPYGTTRDDSTAFPQQTYNYGDGDQRLFVDPASGYFYVYYGSRVVPKGGTGGSTGGLAHVARAPISSKMASGSWSKWYDGAWSQPGVGGRESNMVPVTSANPTGYTPVADDYDPANGGTVDQQVAAGELPAKSDLFIMNIAYDAHLGLYIGEPEVVSGTAPQRFYVTDDLSTQKWRLIGDSGSYTSGSWYRWMVDSANRTSSTIVGKTFRSYCSIACARSDGEYAEVTVGSSAPAAPPVDPAKAYRIGSGSGRVLAQTSGGPSVTSLAPATGSNLEAWTFTGNGDGSYRIANAATGNLLGVDSAAKAGRAWAAQPSATAPGSGGPTVGQQWFIVPQVSSGGVRSGAYRLVNRYSGLVLGMSSQAARLAETTPIRTWTDTTGSGVGGSRTAAEQTLTLTATGSAPANLNGPHTVSVSGKALDDPDWSKAPGIRLVTWSLNGGTNQTWNFTQQSDGSYTLVNAYSNLCADDEGGLTAPGTAVIQWTCTGGANQRWRVTRLASDAYTIANAHSGLLLTTSSGSDGGRVTQQADTHSALQQWTIT
ncbi:RICIN domain-containing protein [Streptomyces sp. TLI_146]|uniref:RICIN domain-containing protein n=1 Tax=Streptomyces sp. TLI_146 TaxID=1938858 RepID=UPI000CCAFBF2|nr:RICIN domain-containing protein [Streptomyces sp. TLI_146]PKV83714.1 ricin-type beta-trefoil lectin protein [Streptomyces sp. TLI_146]